ncbi:hypothetical protein SAY87_021149 [Trapa incisa]|uniref:Uncharacterized protein n=1 Tax=Trapa incisa TaxID=236973 RepID=A0AAN7JRR6_9MYRT|nr:hypothetical protein SAY87_021149 [Trapa incisa]
MGCISSKVISRSMSLRDDWNQRQQLFRSSKGRDRDQFLALISTSNKVPNGSTDVDPNTDIYSGIIEHIKGADSGGEILLPTMPKFSFEGLELGLQDPPKRSKSWHQFPEDNTSSSTRQSCDDDEFEWKNYGVPRSQSFHTVEEFDELLKRIHLTSIPQSRDGDDKPVLKETQNHAATLDEFLVKETLVNEGEADEASPIFSTESMTKDDASLEKLMERKGHKRRSLARGLDSLKIPGMVELSAVGSLREWLEVGGQVYSPGTYVTPKFGSYISSRSKDENDCSKGYTFNPELVTAIDEDMQQLQAEEETILKQIAENWKELGHGEEEDLVKEEPATKIEKLDME